MMTLPDMSTFPPFQLAAHHAFVVVTIHIVVGGEESDAVFIKLYLIFGGVELAVGDGIDHRHVELAGRYVHQAATIANDHIAEFIAGCHGGEFLAGVGTANILGTHVLLLEVDFTGVEINGYVEYAGDVVGVVKGEGGGTGSGDFVLVREGSFCDTELVEGEGAARKVAEGV